MLTQDIHCLENCLVICKVTLCYAASDTFRIQPYSELLFTHIYSAMFKHILSISKAYSDLFRHIQHPVWPFPYSEPWPVLNMRQIQNPVKLWLGIFKTQSEQFIQTYSDHCITIAYTEAWHIKNPGILTTFL